MKEKPLTEKEFEAAKLVVTAGHHGDDTLMPFGTFTYEQYLWARWFFVKGEPMCAVDHMHQINEYCDGCRLKVNHKTDEMEVIKQYGDSSYECEECLGRKTQAVLCMNEVEEFEGLYHSA